MSRQFGMVGIVKEIENSLPKMQTESITTPNIKKIHISRSNLRRPLSLLFVTGSLCNQNSGFFLSLLNTAQTLLQYGQQAFIIGTKDALFQTIPNCYQALPCKAFWKIGPYSLHFTPFLKAWLRKNGRRPFDIVHLQGIWQYNSSIVAQWSKKRGIPYLISPRGSFNPDALQFSRWKKYIAKKLYVQKVLSNASCFHALTQKEYEAIRKYGLTQPVCIIPNGINIPNPRNVRTIARKKAILEKLNGKKICLFLGRLHPIKGLEDLLKAWAKLSELNGDWILVLAGPSDGGYQSELEKLINRLNLYKTVFLPGSQYGPDKAQWFQSASLFVLPSKSEGFAMAVLEALSYKLPVLLTDTCNFPEIETNKAGIVTDPSVDGLTEGLYKIMNMPDSQRQEMGLRGYNLVKEHYTWQSITNQLIDVYRWILGLSDKPSSVVCD
jgi:poly(glycerol-phosphate) alpha-glucosyltransferase